MSDLTEHSASAGPAIPVDWATDFFSPLYLTLYRDHLLDDEATAAEAAFVMEAIGMTPETKALDLACGFGRHMRWWRAQGMSRIAGLDLSHEFLRSAATALASPAAPAADAPALVQGLAERLPFASHAFDAVVCLFNSLGYQDLAAVGIEANPGEACDIAALPLAVRAARGINGSAAPSLARDAAIAAEAARVLRPGGAFMVDVPARRGMIATIEEHPLTHIITSGGYEIAEHWSVDSARHLLFNEGLVTRRDKEWRYRYCVFLYDRPALEAILTAAGFRIEQCWDDFDGHEFDDEDSDRLIVLARR